MVGRFFETQCRCRDCIGPASYAEVEVVNQHVVRLSASFLAVRCGFTLVQYTLMPAWPYSVTVNCFELQTYETTR